ncbi:hypothetical protein GCM10023322_23390 [Rugosimonospora acidiphila]|uniref:Uncharacterized protein n=1 Tax=Rugosimonospora acidiphila TaxID=556531 RepID=A0ABP9RPM4_9ACTN
MDEYLSAALTVDVSEAVATVNAIAVNEASRQSDLLMGGPIDPHAPDRPDESTSDGSGSAPPAPRGDADRSSARRELASQLVQLRIDLGVGLDPIGTLVGLRRWGVTWELIAQAAGISRQAAHERWGRRVRQVLDRYGTGELGGPVADDEGDLRDAV